jgi:TRAP-type C4-dicarboxylate transport system permease small subunit
LDRALTSTAASGAADAVMNKKHVKIDILIRAWIAHDKNKLHIPSLVQTLFIVFCWLFVVS